MFINIYIYIGLLSGCVFCTLILSYHQACTHAHTTVSPGLQCIICIMRIYKNVPKICRPCVFAGAATAVRVIRYRAPHRIFIIIIIYYLPSGVVVKFDRLHLNI